MTAPETSPPTLTATPPVTPPVIPSTAPPTPLPKPTSTSSQTAAPVDWSLNGRNWNDDMCLTGSFQSPVNIDTKNTKENNKVKFAFNFQPYENLTLELFDQAGQLSVNLSDYSRLNKLSFWNELGEHFEYFLESY